MGNTTSVADLRRGFGEEYPAAVVQNGIRMPLQRESRFSRHYYSEEHKTGCMLSRFTDHSASITALELQQEWANWPGELQMDFCQSCYWLFSQADYPEMLRYVMRHGGPEHRSTIALNVASSLPQAEAFDLLVRDLQNSGLDRTANFAQAIAKTRHPEAEAVLRDHLARLWKHSALWDNAKFINWIALTATTCIAHLIELGAPPADFAEQAGRLSQHVCPRNRNSSRMYLSKHYPEINFPE